MRPGLGSGARIALALLVALAAPASAQEVTGKWVLSVNLTAGSGDATFVFTVEGNALKGTYSGALGEHPVTGTVEGATVKFGFSEDQVGRVSYEGTIEGTTMKGTCTYGMLGEGTFTGKKADG